jgi:hypothetical protein
MTAELTGRERIRLRDKDGRHLGSVIAGYPDFPPTYDMGEMIASVPVPADWGPWDLCIGDTYEVLSVKDDMYEVSLRECRTSAQVPGWIMQLAGKGRAGHACLGGLVLAVDDILHPQRRMCSFGKNLRPLTLKTIRELAAEARQVRDLGLKVYADDLANA